MKELKKIKYIVQLNNNFRMTDTTIKCRFCGSLERIANDRMYFLLNGSDALVIVPDDKIEWMAPSSIFWDKGYRYENVLGEGSFGYES